MPEEIVVKMSDELKEQILSEYIDLVTEFVKVDKDKLTNLIKDNSVDYIFRYAEALDLKPEQKEKLKKLRSFNDYSGIFLTKESPTLFRSPESVAKLVLPALRYEKQEHFQVALTNVRYELIKIEDVSIGGVAQADVSPREVFTSAIEHGASGIILIHNHPSGNPEPSRQDIEITSRFVEAGELLGIKVIDHIIIGDKQYHSMVEERTMPEWIQQRNMSSGIREKNIVYVKADEGGKQRLFLDMDGTLAVFTPTKNIEDLYEEGYFLNLQPINNVVEAVKNILSEREDIEVNILSAVLTDSSYALKEKNMWLDKYLPEISKENRIFMPCGGDKTDYIPGGVRENDFLLDDYTKNLKDWQPPARAIKLLNGINDTKGTWEHDKISFRRNPKDLADKVINVMKGRENVLDNGESIRKFMFELSRDRSMER